MAKDALQNTLPQINERLLAWRKKEDVDINVMLQEALRFQNAINDIEPIIWWLTGELREEISAVLKGALNAMSLLSGAVSDFIHDPNSFRRSAAMKLCVAVMHHNFAIRAVFECRWERILEQVHFMH